MITTPTTLLLSESHNLKTRLRESIRIKKAQLKELCWSNYSLFFSLKAEIANKLMNKYTLIECERHEAYHALCDSTFAWESPCTALDFPWRDSIIHTLDKLLIKLTPRCLKIQADVRKKVSRILKEKKRGDIEYVSRGTAKRSAA